MFVAGALAIAVLADWVRPGTEKTAEHVGPAVGGLLNVSFGSLAEVILALFVPARSEAKVVQAQITGSIVNTSPDLFPIAAAAFTVDALAADGETTWCEGVLLMGVYGLLGLAFFFAGG